MAGQLVLLTPVASPVGTQPPSPTMSSSGEPTTFSDCRPTFDSTAAAQDSRQDAGLVCADLPAAAASSSTGSSPKSPVYAKKWKSPPCCDGCGAAKASGGQCAGCGGRYCTACMGSPAGTSSSNGSPSSAGGSAGDHGIGGNPCNNCSNLCNSCKPVTCCFCEDLRQQAGAARLCEACAGVCDACQRAACGPCKAEFSSCSGCGYSACEDCTLQLQLQYGGSGMGSLVGPSGAVSCWCAPPLRMASNVRHVSSQRYQMAQLHPSFLACTMEAAGLRDADYDIDEDVSYDTDDVIMGQLSSSWIAEPESDQADNPTSAHSAGNGTSSSGSVLGHRLSGQGFAGMDAKALETTIGSLPGLSSHLSLPLSPTGSSHSSLGHYGAARAQGLAGVLELAASMRHPEHSLRGWLDGSH